MGKIAGKVPKLQEKLFDFPYFRQKFDRLFFSPFRLRKKTYCFLETKECMHNEVGTCAEILPVFFFFHISMKAKQAEWRLQVN